MQLLRPWAWGLLFGLLSFGTVSCFDKDKDDDPTPDPVTPVAQVGTVDGTLTPVGSISRIIISEPGSQSGQVTGPDVNGYFRFTNINVGTYNVSFEANQGYVAPAPRSVTVTNGGTASLGTITVAPSAPTNTSVPVRGTVRWSVGSTSYTSATVSGYVYLTNGSASSLDLLATAQNGTTADIAGLNMPYFGGTGLYRLENVMFSSTATYLRTVGGVPYGSFATSGYAGILGTITVTAYDATARTISGTFGYTAYDPRGSAPLGTDRITVSNGSFNLSY